MCIRDRTYADRYRHIKEVKIRHTEEKRIQQGGFMNADDYGNVPLPEDYHFTPIPADGDFIGYSGWAENFAAMLEIHPIYVDPIEILCGRWGDQLTKYLSLIHICVKRIRVVLQG